MHAQLTPGDTLNLRPVAKLFNISVTPMREALLRLVSEKLLKINERGTIVVPALTLEEMLEIQSIRKDLEGRAAALAVNHATKKDIARLEEFHRRMLEAKQTEERRETLSWNAKFHLTLCELGRCPITYEIVETLWVRCGPSLIHLFNVGLEQWDPHPHLDVIDALRTGDGPKARDAISRDIEFFSRRLQAASAAESDAS